MNNQALQVIVAFANKMLGAAGTVLTQITPALAVLGPDVAALVTDFNKLIVDLEAKGASIITALQTIAQIPTPPPAAPTTPPAGPSTTSTAA